MILGNFVIYRENIRKLYDMITGYGSQGRDTCIQKKVEGDIKIDSDLSASTRIGKVKKNQEDAVLIMKHKSNQNYKMMVIADGVGGNVDGEKASYICVSEMREWFDALHENDFINEKHLIDKLFLELDLINSKINSLKNGAATTFVCALVAEKNTYIVNIGDSRAYKIDGKKFEQISVDDSMAEEFYKNGSIKLRDDMRFLRTLNYVTNYLGKERINVSPNLKTIRNNEYDAILLFSDGVTDCLSDNQIYAITKKTAPKMLAQKIVEKALKTTSKRVKQESDQVGFYEEIPAGKDNTTAAVLLNKRKEENQNNER